MTRHPDARIAASIRQRLLNLARSRGEELEFLLVLYAIERFLHRLAASKHRTRFVLKGAMLFLAWKGSPARPTRDLDLLGFGEITADSIRTMLIEVCATDMPDDGLRFETESIQIQPIREEQEYGGLRASLRATLGTAIIRCQIDIGKGDAVTPGPELLQFPSLLAPPGATVLAYPKETVVAEKIEAMVKLGIANTRMKDFYDVWLMAKSFPFEAGTLAKAVRATFDRRKTDLPIATPIALTAEFLRDSNKQSQWAALRKRLKLDAPSSLENVGGLIADFVELPFRHARDGTTPTARWNAAGRWIDG